MTGVEDDVLDGVLVGELLSSREYAGEWVQCRLFLCECSVDSSLWRDKFVLSRKFDSAASGRCGILYEW